MTIPDRHIKSILLHAKKVCRGSVKGKEWIYEEQVRLLKKDIENIERIIIKNSEL